MASLTELLNRALSIVGDNRITGPDDTSKQAQAVLAAWPLVRQEMLEEHPWNFAKVYASIAATSDTPTWRYAYSYNLPADCLVVEEVNLTGTAWELVGDRKLYSDDAGPIEIAYTKDQTDVTRYSASFTMAAAYRLALEVCEELTQSSTKKSDIAAMYQVRLGKAKRKDGAQNSPLMPKRGRWVTARFR